MKSIFLVFIFVLSFGFVQNLNAQKKQMSEAKNNIPSLSDFEFIFGQTANCFRAAICVNDEHKQIECPDETEFVCFEKNRRTLIKVEFNSSKYAKKVFISDGTNFYDAVRAAEQIIMLKGRGRLVKKTDKTLESSCSSQFTEEYKFLTMQYYSQTCQGAFPGQVVIVWK